MVDFRVKETPYIPRQDTIGAIGWRIMFGAAELVATSCSHCEDAVSLVVFMKDVVNCKTGKPIHDKANFKFWMDIVNKVDFNEESFFEETTKPFDKLLDMLADRPSPNRTVTVLVEHDAH